MQTHDAWKLPDWGWLVLAIVCVSLVFGTAIAYFIQTLPSADPPHPLLVGQLVLTAIAFTVMVALVLALAIATTRYWDRQASAWETLICLTTAMVVAPATLATAEHFGAPRGDAAAKVLAFAVAIAGYVLARWLYRRWRPPVPRPEGRFWFGDWWR